MHQIGKSCAASINKENERSGASVDLLTTSLSGFHFFLFSFIPPTNMYTQSPTTQIPHDRGVVPIAPSDDALDGEARLSSSLLPSDTGVSDVGKSRNLVALIPPLLAALACRMLLLSTCLMPRLSTAPRAWSRSVFPGCV